MMKMMKACRPTHRIQSSIGGFKPKMAQCSQE